MKKRLTKEDLGDGLCQYCPLEKKGVYGVPGGSVAGCEGCKCDEAYNIYVAAMTTERLTEEQKQKLCDLIEKSLNGARLKKFKTDDDDNLPLVDLLSTGETILEGQEEIENIVEQIFFDMDDWDMQAFAAQEVAAAIAEIEKNDRTGSEYIDKSISIDEYMEKNPKLDPHEQDDDVDDTRLGLDGEETWLP